jgi:hypothetical protein
LIGTCGSNVLPNIANSRWQLDRSNAGPLIDKAVDHHHDFVFTVDGNGIINLIIYLLRISEIILN